VANLIQNAITRHRKVARQTLAELSEGALRRTAVHHLRTRLRRLQALLTLSNDERHTAKLARSVSRLSPLRTWQVFELYLSRIGAPASDLRKVRAARRRAERKIARKQVLRRIRQRLGRLDSPPAIRDPARRFTMARAAHARTLHTLMEQASHRPRRKILHALRLAVKTIRYQEELAARLGWNDQGLLDQLKEVQAILGRYEERAQFRKLARKLDLRCLAAICNDWRAARKEARKVPGRFPQLVHLLEAQGRPPASRLPSG
jgi:CHAD domain-containing protein